MRRSVSGACDIVAVLLTRERRCTVIEHALDTVTCHTVGTKRHRVVIPLTQRRCSMGAMDHWWSELDDDVLECLAVGVAAPARPSTASVMQARALSSERARRRRRRSDRD